MNPRDDEGENSAAKGSTERGRGEEMPENSVEEMIAIGAKVVGGGFAEKVVFDWCVESALG